MTRVQLVQAVWRLLIFGLPALGVWWLLGSEARRERRKGLRGFEVGRKGE